MLTRLRSILFVGFFLQGRSEDVEKIKNFHCIFYDNEDFICKWTPIGDTSDLSLSYQFNGSSNNICPNMSVDKTSCRFTSLAVDALSNLLWRFKVTTGGHVYNFSLRPEDVVKPNPVTSLEVSSPTDNASCGKISWHFDNNYDKIVQITYTNEWNETKGVNTSVNNLKVDWRKICNLIPSSLYTFTSSVISVPVGDTQAHGFWSEKVITQFKTEESVPAAAPVIAVGNYERDVNNCENHNSIAPVIVYWKEIEPRYRYGKIINYHVTSISQKNGKITENTEDGTSTSSKLRLKCDESYKIEIIAATKKGVSNFSSSIWIASSTNKDLYPPRDVLVLLDKKENKLTYNISLPAMCVDGRCNYSVHYCRKTLQTCNDEMVIVHVPVSEPFYLLEDLAHPVQIGVSVDRGLNSSGFQFIRCVHNKTAVPAVVQGVEVATRPANGLTVSWTPETKCTGSANIPYVVKYMLTYCEVNTNKQCTGEEHVVNVTTNEYVIEDLDTKKDYGVQVSASSWYKTGNHSEMRVARPKNNDFSTSKLVGICVGGTIAFVLAIIGFIQFIRCCIAKRKEFKDLGDIDVPYVECSKGQKITAPANRAMHNLLSTNETDIESKPLLSVSKKFGHHKNSLDSGRGTMAEQEMDQNGCDSNVQTNAKVSFAERASFKVFNQDESTSVEADSSEQNDVGSYTSMTRIDDTSEDVSNQLCHNQSALNVIHSPTSNDTFSSRTTPSTDLQNVELKFPLHGNSGILNSDMSHVASEQYKYATDSCESPWVRNESSDTGDDSIQAWKNRSHISNISSDDSHIPNSSMSENLKMYSSGSDKGMNSVSEYVKKHVNCSEDTESDTKETSFINPNDHNPKLVQKGSFLDKTKNKLLADNTGAAKQSSLEIQNGVSV